MEPERIEGMESLEDKEHDYQGLGEGENDGLGLGGMEGQEEPIEETEDKKEDVTASEDKREAEPAEQAEEALSPRAYLSSRCESLSISVSSLELFLSDQGVEISSLDREVLDYYLEEYVRIREEGGGGEISMEAIAQDKEEGKEDKENHRRRGLVEVESDEEEEEIHRESVTTREGMDGKLADNAIFKRVQCEAM